MKCVGSLLTSVIIVSVVMTNVCHVVALVTAYWLRSTASNLSGFLNLGLWRVCFDNFRHPHEKPPRNYIGCHELESEYFGNLREWLMPPWLSVCRTLSTISLAFMLISLALSALVLTWSAFRWLDEYSRKHNELLSKIFLYATPTMHAITGVFMMLTLAIFADNAHRLQCRDFWLGAGDPYSSDLSFSWGFELVASILSCLSSGLFVWFAILKNRDDI